MFRKSLQRFGEVIKSICSEILQCVKDLIAIVCTLVKCSEKRTSLENLCSDAMQCFNAQ